MNRNLFLCCMLVACFLLYFTQALAEPRVPVESPKAENRSENINSRNGFVPQDIDLSHLTGRTAPDDLRTMSTPAQWDWRTTGKVTSVKNQSSCGSCYAFASIANIESKLLIDGQGTFDLSENNAKECNWYDTNCNGGNYTKMANLFSKKGVVLESCDPYVASNQSCNSSCAYQFTLLDWRIICTGSVPSTSTLKQYIYDNGPVYTSMYAGNGDAWASEFGSYDGSYGLYYAGGETPNHAVFIVGWDDSGTHNGGGTGVWIVKNSWGTSWGGTCGYGSEAGYFTIAYGSANIGQYSSYINSWEAYNSNGDILYYDEGGWTTGWGYGTTTVWALSKFVIPSTTYITRVEFWTTDITTDVDVYIYDDFDGNSKSNLLASNLNNQFDEAGYHSVELTTPYLASSSQDVYVVVKFTNDSYTYPLAADDQGPNETSTTYMSSSGGDGTWYDLGAGQSDDACIRLRTSTTLDVGTEEFAQVPDDLLILQNYPNPFNARTNIEYGVTDDCHVDLRVYNLLGREVATLVDGFKHAGYHKAVWNSGEVPSGVYFYRLTAGENTQTRKMIVLK
ncbi:MAG: T9SS type A sorting domain-containing protein [candidate division Zixibacteria bacterium]|nr:T9SS type A sorting domain-containing protein [candidate division Zixibacteria bacterium]